MNDYVCGRASEWILNGTEFCHAAGFSVEDDTSESLEETFCYGGKASLDLIADSWKISQFEVPQKVERLRLLEELQQRVREMSYSERVSWAVGGLVLTAGLLFVRWGILILPIKSTLHYGNLDKLVLHCEQYWSNTMHFFSSFKS